MENIMRNSKTSVRKHQHDATWQVAQASKQYTKANRVETSITSQLQVAKIQREAFEAGVKWAEKNR
jgi:phosphoribosylamine-glycine ligase